MDSMDLKTPDKNKNKGKGPLIAVIAAVVVLGGAGAYFALQSGTEQATQDGPPSLELEESTLQGRIFDSSLKAHEIEEGDFDAPSDAVLETITIETYSNGNPSNPFHYFWTENDLTVEEVLANISAPAGTKVIIGEFDPVENCYNTSPAGPWPLFDPLDGNFGHCEVPLSHVIEGGKGFFVFITETFEYVAEHPDAEWGMEYSTELPSTFDIVIPDTAAGWILVPAPADLETALAPYQSRIISVYEQLTADTFSEITDNYSSRSTDFGLIWVEVEATQSQS